MNVLLIGGAGYLGSNIVEHMLDYDSYFQIYVLEPDCANTTRLEGLSVNVIRGDFSDIQFIQSLVCELQIKKVVHFVSSMVPGCGYDEYVKEVQLVVFPTMRLMQLCSRLGVQFVYFSSGGTIYGDRKDLTAFQEADPQAPISYYGLTKQIIENNILFEHRTNGLKYLILRPSNPYGCGQRTNGRQGLIAVALGKVLAGDSITIWGDGSQVRDYIYVKDLATIVVEILRQDLTDLTVNIGSGKGYSTNEIIDIIRNIVEEPVTLNNIQERKTDVSNMILDNSLMKSLVDVSLTPIEDGIRKFYQELKSKLM